MDSNSSNIVAWVAMAIAILALGTAYFGGPGAAKILGADGDSNFTNVVASGDITAGDDLTAGGDLTLSGGTLTVTTSNTATSTIVGGCFQTYATSTATPWRSYASSTATVEGVDGVMLAQYGSCPSFTF